MNEITAKILDKELERLHSYLMPDEQRDDARYYSAKQTTRSEWARDQLHRIYSYLVEPQYVSPPVPELKPMCEHIR